MADARKKVDTGVKAEKVEAELGKASFAVRTEGTSVHDIWKYYFADGTLTINLVDGYVARVGTHCGPPKIRKTGRP